MRIKLSPKSETQLLQLLAASGVECNVTHYLNLLINEKHNTQIPQVEDQHGHTTKENLPLL